jgi:hypothetical protein
MDLSPARLSRLFHSSHLIDEVEQACLWAKLEKGRATCYAQLITEYFAGQGISYEHVLAYHEAMEITELHKLWEPRIDNFPGLKEKIAETLTSGPSVQDDETPLNSGPRNYAFSYSMAGRLQVAGCDVICVDGISRTGELGTWFGDVTIRHEGFLLDVQCKRPYFAENVQKNVRRAEKQILAAYPRVGVIAIDTSLFIRPQGTLWQANSVRDAVDKVSQLIEPHAQAVANRIKRPQIAGLIWFGRLPCVVSEPSRILTSSGGRYKLRRLYSAYEVAIWINDLSPMAPILYDIAHRLNAWMKSTGTDIE